MYSINYNNRNTPTRKILYLVKSCIGICLNVFFFYYYYYIFCLYS